MEQSPGYIVKRKRLSIDCYSKEKRRKYTTELIICAKGNRKDVCQT